MFTPPIPEGTRKTSQASTNKLATERLRVAARPVGDDSTERKLLNAEAPRLTSSFAQVPIFPPGRPDRLGALPSRSAPAPTGAPQAKLVIGATKDPLEHEADRVADRALRVTGPQHGCRPSKDAVTSRTRPAVDPTGSVPDIVYEVLRSPGQSLDAPTRAFFEPRLGHDLSQVRLHADERAAQSARAIGATAYTAGQAIVFDQGAFAPANQRGRRLLGHELAHVIQQSVRGATVGIQRYEAGEHAQFGETETDLKTLINAPASIYVVQAGETPTFIATAFAVSVEDLLQRNKSKVKQVPVPGKKGKTVAGFAAGEKIEIPKAVNQATRDALAVKELSFDAGKADTAGKRARVTYGEGIAMGGDLFASPGQVDATERSKIENLQKLIQDEKTSSKKGEFVDSATWQAETDQRFLDLAFKNESHFAPSNPAIASATSRAAGSPNNKSEWERYHAEALMTSKGGDRDKALQVNSFADHFLTDAFAAGHLINKLDVMEKFKGGIKIIGSGPMTAKSDLTPDSAKFFDQVAHQSFVGPVKALFSQYETVEWKGVVFRPDIDSESRFSELLQGIYKEEPDQVASLVSKVVHDALNTRKGGISVENQNGDKWQLSGDRTLNGKTLEVGRKAVAQSQYNVLSVFKQANKPDLPKLFKAVWDHVPRPTGAGTADVKAAVDLGTDPKQAELVKAMANIVKAEHVLILNELVRRNKLKKA